MSRMSPKTTDDEVRQLIEVLLPGRQDSPETREALARRLRSAAEDVGASAFAERMRIQQFAEDVPIPPRAAPATTAPAPAPRAEARQEEAAAEADRLFEIPHAPHRAARRVRGVGLPRLRVARQRRRGGAVADDRGRAVRRAETHAPHRGRRDVDGRGLHPVRKNRRGRQRDGAARVAAGAVARRRRRPSPRGAAPRRRESGGRVQDVADVVGRGRGRGRASDGVVETEEQVARGAGGQGDAVHAAVAAAARRRTRTSSITRRF